ncbi:MAG: hypothetical protein Q9214_001901, partial [Letrouitia sp. 1 TL-2023]
AIDVSFLTQDWLISVWDPLKVNLDLIRPFNKSLTLAPGQSRPLGFRIHVDPSHPYPLSLSFQLIYAFNDRPRTFLTEATIHPLDFASPGKPHKFTFFHPSGVVSYAMLRPPSQTVRDAEPSSSLPIIINLHGASLEASSDQVRQMLDDAPNLRAWALFPTGMSAWSGDDWHHWGFGDLEAAIAAIPQWISHVHWQGPFVDSGKWLVKGLGSPLRTDQIRLLGLLRSQAIRQYRLWVEVDPKLTALLHGSLSPYRHELLLENCKGIPIQLQHGSLDDNVPVFHSRRMNELVLQTDWDTQYAELAGKRHWFEGAMTTAPLVEFYNRVLTGNTSKPLTLDSFEIVVADPGDSDPRYGIKIDQKIAPGQLGRIKLRRRLSDDVLLFSTSNIHRFQILKQESFGQIPDKVVVDDQHFDLSFEGERHGRQSGSLDAILRSRGSFVVVAPEPQLFNISMQIARNLHQYFGADVEIGGPDESLGKFEGNVITVALGEKRFSSTNFPIRLVQGRGLVVRTNHAAEKVYPVAGLGIIHIKPLEDERLELLIWGYDHAGLGQAARLLPMLTGVGQPDFVVVSRSCGWKGAAGVRAMGRFDMFWKVSSDSYLT